MRSFLDLFTAICNSWLMINSLMSEAFEHNSIVVSVLRSFTDQCNRMKTIIESKGTQSFYCSMVLDNCVIPGSYIMEGLMLCLNMGLDSETIDTLAVLWERFLESLGLSLEILFSHHDYFLLQRHASTNVSDEQSKSNYIMDIIKGDYIVPPDKQGDLFLYFVVGCLRDYVERKELRYRL